MYVVLIDFVGDLLGTGTWDDAARKDGLRFYRGSPT